VLTKADENREVQNKVVGIARIVGLDAEVVAKRTETTPRGRLEKRLSDRASRYGTTIYWASLGQGSRITGAAPDNAPNAIIINRDADPKAKIQAVFFHEITHVLQYNEPGLWRILHDSLTDSAPDLYKDSKADYAKRYKRQFGKTLGEDCQQQEAVAVTAETVTRLLLKAERREPGYLLKRARKEPGKFLRLYNALYKAFRLMRIPGFKGREAPLEGPDLFHQRVMAAIHIRQALQTLEDIRSGKIESPEAKRLKIESGVVGDKLTHVNNVLKKEAIFASYSAYSNDDRFR
jgi:hypothetical protein